MRVHLEDRAVCYLKSPLSQHYIIIIILLNYLNNAIQWPKPRNLPSLTGTTEAGELLAGFLLGCAPNGNGILWLDSDRQMLQYILMGQGLSSGPSDPTCQIPEEGK